MRFPVEAKLKKRIQEIQPFATTCSARELAILAVAVEELALDHKVDAMKELTVIQVVSWILLVFLSYFGSEGYIWGSGLLDLDSSHQSCTIHEPRIRIFSGPISQSLIFSAFLA